MIDAPIYNFSVPSSSKPGSIASRKQELPLHRKRPGQVGGPQKSIIASSLNGKISDHKHSTKKRQSHVVKQNYLLLIILLAYLTIH